MQVFMRDTADLAVDKSRREAVTEVSFIMREISRIIVRFANKEPVMSDKDKRDEAYMQEAIRSAKENGTLTEVNPQDAPAPVHDDLSGHQPGGNHPASLPDAKLTAEDKAFDELATRIGVDDHEAPSVERPAGVISDFRDNSYAAGLFSKIGQGKMDILMAALREGQDPEARDNGVLRIRAMRTVQTALYDLAENRDAKPFDDSTGLSIAKEVAGVLFTDLDVIRRVNTALERQDELERESPGAHTARVKAQADGITPGKGGGHTPGA